MKRGKLSNKLQPITVVDLSSFFKIKEEDNLLTKISKSLKLSTEKFEPVGEAFNWLIKIQTNFEYNLRYCLVGNEKQRKKIIKCLNKVKDQYLVSVNKIHEFDNIWDFKIWIKRNINIEEVITSDTNLFYTLGTEYKVYLAPWA